MLFSSCSTDSSLLPNSRLSSVRSTQIETLVKRHHHWARVADSVIQHLDAYLSATQLGITLASFGSRLAGRTVCQQRC